MAQHDYEVSNAVGADLRADLNAVAAAIRTANMGITEPVARFPGMWWLDSKVVATPGVLKIMSQQNNLWLALPLGTNFVPIAGGNITGDLSVAGIFSDDEYNAMRANWAGPTAPLSPGTGMLWYDTSTSPAILKVRTASGWTPVLPVANPVFTNSVTVQSGTLASLNLVSATERRRAVSDAAGDRMAFYYGAADTFTGAVTDAGDVTLVGVGSLAVALQGKQPSLGFTPVREGGGTGMYASGAVRIHIGWSGTHILAQVNDTPYGYIYTSVDRPPATSQKKWSGHEIGSMSWCYVKTEGANWTGDSLIDGSWLYYAYDGGAQVSTVVGTWRNLAGSPPGGGYARAVPCQRWL
jgi:hypothetical protein